MRLQSTPILQLQSPLNASTWRGGTRYLQFLAAVLLGYAFAGKGFAYLIYPPVFISEIALAIGIFVAYRMPHATTLFRWWRIHLLVAFMVWGALRTLPFLSTYGIDAVRDAALYYYAAYAIIITAILAAEPARITLVLKLFRKYAFWFPIIIPISWFFSFRAPNLVPAWPGSDTPVLLIKGGDMIVHLTGVFAFLAIVANEVPIWTLLILPVILLLSFSGRSSIVTFGSGALLITIFNPRSKVLLRFFAIVAVGIAILWATGIHYSNDDGSTRDVSISQIYDNFTSMVTDSGSGNLDSTKEWRQKFWNDIINDTFDGPYFWTGKGYGVSLPKEENDYLASEPGLRSPHSAHLTFLARSGVPGLVLWAAVQLTWAFGILQLHLRSRRERQTKWAALTLFLLVYWLAFLVNASFDVFLEGPMGGIWFWSIYGLGLSSLWIYPRRPEAILETSGEATNMVLNSRLAQRRGRLTLHEQPVQNTNGGDQQ